MRARSSCSLRLFDDLDRGGEHDFVKDRFGLGVQGFFHPGAQALLLKKSSAFSIWLDWIRLMLSVYWTSSP